jgi:glutathione S-transferase
VYDRARMRIWIDWITSRFIPSYHRFLQHQPSGVEGGSDAGLEDARQEFLGLVKEFTREMSAEGPYFFGGEVMMIDLMLAPWAVRTWVFDHFKGGFGVPREGEGGEDEKTWVRWRKWVAAIESRESVKRTLSEREHYLPIYGRYAEDKAQSEMAKATRKGRGVP